MNENSFLAIGMERLTNMSHEDRTKLLLKGTAILAAAALLSKLLGVVYRIPYQNITGDLGLYVYQQVYPLYSIILILATAGFPIAVSKLVAERLALGDPTGAKRIFNVSIWTLAASGIIFFLGLYLSAPFIAAFMEDDGLTLPLRSVSFALLIVPVMAAIRGYFQGYQNMLPTGVSQIAEQIIRVVTIIILSYWFMNQYGDEYLAGSGAVFGAVTGAFAALVVLLLFWRKVTSKPVAEVKELAEKHLEEKSQIATEPLGAPDKTQDLETESFAQLKPMVLVKRILFIAIPICLGAMVLPLFQFVDSLTVPKVLIHSGVIAEDARQLKGIFDRGQPLVQFAAFFATALSLALVPSISEAYAQKNHEQIRVRSDVALRLTLYLGLAASVGLAVLAIPVNIMLYKTTDGSLALAVLAFTSIFSTLGIASAAILQGLGHVYLPARNLFIGVLVKLALNIILIPIWGIVGAALATVLAYMVATIINLLNLRRLIAFKITFRNFFAKPLLAVGAMGLAVWLTTQGLLIATEGLITSERLYYSFTAINGVVIGALVYAVALLLFGAITRKEFLLIPKLNRLVPVLDKLKILRKDNN